MSVASLVSVSDAFWINPVLVDSVYRGHNGQHIQWYSCKKGMPRVPKPGEKQYFTLSGGATMRAMLPFLRLFARQVMRPPSQAPMLDKNKARALKQSLAGGKSRKPKKKAKKQQEDQPPPQEEQPKEGRTTRSRTYYPLEVNVRPLEDATFKKEKPKYKFEKIPNYLHVEQPESESSSEEEEESSSESSFSDWGFSEEDSEDWEEVDVPAGAQEFPPPLSVPPVLDPILPTELTEWNPNWLFLQRDPARKEEIEPEKLMIFYGKRGSGKTFAMRHLCYIAASFIPLAFVMTNTKFNQYWQRYFPEQAVINGFDTDMLQTWLKEREKYIAKWEKDPWRQKHENPYALIVLEDCISNTNFNHTETLRVLAANGRHLKVCVMISTQYTKGVGPLLRENTDYAFVFFQETLDQKEAIMENYFSDAKTVHRKEDIMRWIQANTIVDEQSGNRRVIAIDNQRQTNELSKKMFSATFMDPGPFKFGSAEYWEANK